MSQKIHILPDIIANRIAAGEVVTRPASVVKELLENALDAGADEITVEILSSGLASIKVTDNGCGMGPEDIKLAFERHATSKVWTAEDLDRISTLGFRGEALAAIASVSMVEMISCDRESGSTYGIKMDGGKSSGVKPAKPVRGTSVEVGRLFYNTPARKKFLKSPQTEWSHILRVIERAVLSHPEIAFRVEHDGRNCFTHERTGGAEKAIELVCGMEFAQGKKKISLDTADIKIRGYVGDPGDARPNRTSQYFFINSRPIRSIGLSSALGTAYGNLIPWGRYPAAVIFVEIDPGYVDVNVHPSKEEVRFHDERNIQSLVIRAVRDSLSHTEVLAGLKEGNSENRVAEAMHSFVRSSAWPAGNSVTGGRVFSESKQLFAEDDLFANRKVVDRWKAGQITPDKVFQMKDSYIFLELDDGFLVLDQHAACERIRYEAIKERYVRREVGRQNLLLPVKVNFTLHQAAVWEEHKHIFEKLFIKIENFGKNEFVITEIGDILDKKGDLNRLVEDILDCIQKGSDIDMENPLFLERIFYLMACHSSRRAKDRLAGEEMIKICSDLLDLDVPFTCPHGRPVGVKVSWSDVEKMFYRK